MVAGTWALNCLGLLCLAEPCWGKDSHLNLRCPTCEVGTKSQLRGHREGQRICPEALAHDSKLSHGIVTAESTVLFTAPPASAWQLCLPVLYLIPPAKLALNISLPDP